MKTDTKVYSSHYDSPVGPLRIAATCQGICRLAFADSPEKDGHDQWLSSCHCVDAGDDHAVLRRFRKELDGYFSGRRKEFTLELHILRGTAFQQKVWKALTRIPFGQTVCYGDIARKIRNPQAARAVGMANHANDIAIVIPCHRVVNSAGKLHGYGGGLWRKERLLQLERAPGFEADE